MAYYLDLFTPETWAKFIEHGATVSGFRERQRKTAARLKPGDVFLCYIVKVSRWAGLLEIESVAYDDDAPIFDDPDPYTVRFAVDDFEAWCFARRTEPSDKAAPSHLVRQMPLATKGRLIEAARARAFKRS